MRRSLLVFLLINVVIIALLIRSVFTLLTLLTEDGAADAIDPVGIPNHDAPEPDYGQELIPRIIHQTYVNDSIPERWQKAHRTCQEKHPSYEYMLWTDAKSREFIATEYAWFISTFDAYPYPIQRADVIRYFILDHFGGTYLDLDLGCKRRLDPLLAYPAWLHRTMPTGISNDGMGARPHHPFFKLVIASLEPYARNWLLPYVTIMYSTGPLFLSVLWKEYLSSGKNVGDGPDGGRIRIMMEDQYQTRPWSFFLQFVGSSWHRGDARFIFWAGEHWMLLVMMGFMTAGIVWLVAWWVWRRFVSGRPIAGRTNWKWIRRWNIKPQRDYELVHRHEV